MSTPTYIAVKVGDDYELRRIDPEHQIRQAAIVTAGAVISALGFSRKSFMGTGLGLLGAGLVYYGLSGRDPIQDLKSVTTRNRFGIGPSYRHDERGRSSQRPEDALDEAAMESFPASDPPAVHHDQNPDGPTNPAG